MSGNILHHALTQRGLNQTCVLICKHNTYLHLLKDGSTIIGDDDLAVGGDEHLIHTLWTKGSLKETGDSSCGQDVDL